MQKRGQAWGFDLLVGSMVFVVALIGFYLYGVNYNSSDTSPALELEKQGRAIADLLISEGYPIDWDEASVTTPGLMTQNKLNETKVLRFKNLIDSDYGSTKSLLKTNKEVYFEFSTPLEIGNQTIQTIGNIPSSTENRIKIDRIIVYRDKIITFSVGVWE